MSKYEALTRYLAARVEARVQMDFKEVEAVLGFPLPKSARHYRPWWANSGHGHVQARAWLEAGFESSDVDLEAERLVFERQQRAAPERPHGDHPIYGCMTGTVVLPGNLDLTEPLFSDNDVEAWADRKVAVLQGYGA